MNSFNSCMSGNVFFSSLFLKNVIVGCRILGWQFFFLHNFEDVALLLSPHITPNKKSTLIATFVPLHVRSFFFLAAFKIYLSLIFSNLNIICLGIVVFIFFILKSSLSFLDPWVCGKFGEFLTHYSFKYFMFPCFSLLLQKIQFYLCSMAWNWPKFSESVYIFSLFFFFL